MTGELKRWAEVGRYREEGKLSSPPLSPKRRGEGGDQRRL